MVIVSFSVKYAELMEKEKLQTIRLSGPRKRKWRFGMNLQMWWLGQRVKSKYAYQMGTARVVKCFEVKGDEIDDKIAVLDGFVAKNELIRKLMIINNMTIDEVLAATWWIIRWDWTVGPEKRQDVWKKYVGDVVIQKGFCPKTGDFIVIPTSCYKCDEYSKHTNMCGYDDQFVLREKGKR